MLRGANHRCYLRAVNTLQFPRVFLPFQAGFSPPGQLVVPSLSASSPSGSVPAVRTLLSPQLSPQLTRDSAVTSPLSFPPGLAQLIGATARHLRETPARGGGRSTPHGHLWEERIAPIFMRVHEGKAPAVPGSTY